MQSLLPPMIPKVAAIEVCVCGSGWVRESVCVCVRECGWGSVCVCVCV